MLVTIDGQLFVVHGIAEGNTLDTLAEFFDANQEWSPFFNEDAVCIGVMKPCETLEL